MNRLFRIAILGFTVTSILPVLGLAHHSVAQFTNNLATMEGTVVEYRGETPTSPWCAIQQMPTAKLSGG